MTIEHVPKGRGFMLRTECGTPIAYDCPLTQKQARVAFWKAAGSVWAW